MAKHLGDPDGFPEPFGLGGIQFAHALIEIDVAIGAGARAARAHDQKGGRAAGKAFADVGAARLLADRVELEIQQEIGYGTDPLTLGGFHTQPIRLLQVGLLNWVHRDVAQLGSALRSGRRGRRFESCHPALIIDGPLPPRTARCPSVWV